MTRADDDTARPLSTVSVLMSTYAGETADNLDASLRSLVTQTSRPDQIVIVVDGPIGPEQDVVLDAYSSRSAVVLTIVRLPVNRGLAEAMNIGIARCTGFYIMRMDSDDLCQPDRIAVQRAYAEAHPDTDVVCSWSEEFFGGSTRRQIKVSSCDHVDIARALRWRNVLVHPTVFMKAEVLRGVGGYRGRFGRLEDYDLFVRLVLAGARFHVIPKVLVRVRSSIAQRARRGGMKYVWCELRFRTECLKVGFISPYEFIVTATLYAAFRLVSGRARLRLYSLART